MMFPSTANGLQRLCILVAFTMLALVVLANTPARAGGVVNTGYFGDVAIKGYDPVAYFTEKHAMKGSPEFSYEFLGATWYFASAKHRDIFAANPIAYSPQYGGFCAGEVLFADQTTGVTTNIDPEAWRIIDGKLYLFYGKDFAPVFEAHAKEWLVTTEKNWPMVEARLKAKQNQ